MLKTIKNIKYYIIDQLYWMLYQLATEFDMKAALNIVKFLYMTKYNMLNKAITSFLKRQTSCNQDKNI